MDRRYRVSLSQGKARVRRSVSLPCGAGKWCNQEY